MIVLASLKIPWNLEQRSFILPFHHSDPKWARKSHYESDLRFQDCLLTRWLPTTSILVVLERTYRYQFKSNYLKNHKFFPQFFLLFLAFLESTLSFKCSEKNISLIAQVFLKLLSPKYVFNEMDSRACFLKRFGSERVNESQKLPKSTEKYFYPTFWSFWAKLSQEKLFLIRSKISGLLLTRWVPTTSILVVIERIYCYQFKSNYLKNHKPFNNFFFLIFCIFGIYIKIPMLWKKMNLRGQVFLRILTP